MKKENRRRMTISSSYIGSGNNTTVFNRRSKVPFKKIKELYGDELERINSKRISKNIINKELTEIEKNEIKNRIKRNLKQERKKEIIIWIVAIITLLIITKFTVKFINNYR